MRIDLKRSDKRPTASSFMKSEPNVSSNTLNSYALPISKAVPLLSRPSSVSKRPVSVSRRPTSGSNKNLSSSQGALPMIGSQNTTRPDSAKLDHSLSHQSLTKTKKSVSFANVSDKPNEHFFRRCPTPSVNRNDLDMQQVSHSSSKDSDTISPNEIEPDHNLVEEIEKMVKDKEEEDDEFYARLENENEYSLTPFQTEIYNGIFPNSDDSRQVQADGSKFYIARAITSMHEISFSDLKLAVNRVISLYPILQTVFFRNEKILDADIIGTLPGSKEWDPETNKYLEQLDIVKYPELDVMDSEALAEFTTAWMRNHYNFQHLFKVLYIAQLKDLSNPSYTLIFVGANIVLDNLSMNYINREIMNLYSSIVANRQNGYTDGQIYKVLSNYKVKEKSTFLQFSQGCSESKFSMNFWRSQCMEAVQETVEYNEREEFLKELKQLGIEKYNLDGSKDSLTQRINNLSSELQGLIQQRKKLDSGMNGEGPMTQFTDPTTNEVMTISIDAKDALVQSVLGIDTTGSGCVVSFLEKHGVPKDVQRKINAQSLSIEKFAELTQSSLENFPILSRERRKVLALAEYISSRIRESFHEQHKIKGSYERRILKTRRDLEKASDMLAIVKEKLEVNDDMTMRLKAILNPPIYDERILPLNLNAVSLNGYDKDLYLNQTSYAYVPFTVKEDVVNQLRDFREAFLVSKRNLSMGQKDSGSSSGDIISSDESESEKYNEETQTHSRRVRNANSVCMAAFCVLLRHISGQDKFSIGVTQSYRYRDMLVGPLSDTVPLKIDLTKKKMEFRSLFSKMYRGLYHARQQGAACPLSKIAKKYSHVKTLPIRFEYISYKEFSNWEKAGMTVDDFMDESMDYGIQEGRWSKLWTLNERDPFDLKLVLVEKQDSMEGGFIYQPSKFTPGQITKWMIKFQSILSSIEYSQRKIKIATMISRLYHSMWTNSIDGLSSTMSFSSFADLHSQLDLHADQNSSDEERYEHEYSQDTLASSRDILKSPKTKLPSITPDRSLSPNLSIGSEGTKSPIPYSDKAKKEAKSTDTIYIERL